MPPMFPRQTVAWKLEEPSAFRKLTLSLVEMAVITGVLVRLARAIALSDTPDNLLLYLLVAYGLPVALLCGMLTLHIGNFTLRQWPWRVPAFTVLEVAAEMGVSLALIAARREPVGTGRAEFADWPALLVETLIRNLLVTAIFAALLAGVVQLVRWMLLRREHRAHTASAIHQHREQDAREPEHHPDRV